MQKKIIVTVIQVSAVCWVVLLYEARVTKRLLGNFVTLELDYNTRFRGDLWGSLPGPHTSGLPRSYIV